MNKIWLYTDRDFFAAARWVPEIHSLLDTDMYKFTMLDFIIAHPEYRDVNVRREMNIRSKDIRTLDIIPREALEEQFTHCRTLKFTDVDLSFLRGMDNNHNTANGKRLLKEETIDYLKNLQLPAFTIWDDWKNYTLQFEWTWADSTLWEIIWLKIINSLYLYYWTKKAHLSPTTFTEMISRTLVRLFDDIKIYNSIDNLTFSEFGTRRSMSSDFQRTIINILMEQAPDQCLWTSNVLLSRELGLSNPKGTNAHELRMIPTALLDKPQDIIDTMYDIDRQWMQHHPWLGILLADTYGTSFYLNNCPQDIAMNHDGMRFDSKDPLIGIAEYNRFLQQHGRNPKSVIGIPSDGLSAKAVQDIMDVYGVSNNLTFGIGTSLTNNTKHTIVSDYGLWTPFWSFSVVIKPSQVQRDDGTRVSTVKLSDNPNKAMGSLERVQFFKEIFWVEGMQQQETLV